MRLPCIPAALPLGIALTVAVVVIAPLLPRPVHAQGAPRPTQIGIVNIHKLFLAYEKVKELQTALEEEYGLEEAKLNRQLTVLEGRRKDLVDKGWNESDPTFREKLREIALEFEQHKLLTELMTATFRERGHRTTEELYNTLVKRIADYAKANDYAMVVKIMDIPTETNSDQALAKKIGDKEVLYFDASIDITQAVIALVNADR